MHKLKRINLTKPNLDRRELNAVKEVLDSGWLIRGPKTAEFEQEFARFAGAKYGVATIGCTMALYLAVKRLGLKKTDEVIVPSLTWSATASAVINAGATPVFADVGKNDWCLDPADVKRKITKRTRLIIPVDFAGRKAKGFERFRIPVLYDSAHLIRRGSHRGLAGCHSFYAVKNMTTVRGGIVVTDSEKDAAWYRMGVHGGIAKDTLARYKGTAKNPHDASAFYYEVEFPGWNFDMTDVEAAIGLVQLKKVEKLNQKRNEIVKFYNKALGLKNTGNHLYPILVENRDEFLVKMRDAGVQCGIHYLPLHLMKAYKNYSRSRLPVTEYIGARCVSLPLYPSLTKSQMAYIVVCVKKFAALTK